LRQHAQAAAGGAEHRGADRHHVGVDGHQAHGCKVPGRIEAGVLQRQRDHRHRVAVGDEQGIAVRARGLERLGRDLATGAGLVLDHHVAPQLLLQAMGQVARDGIRAAAGREADQQPDRRRAVGQRNGWIQPGGKGDCAGSRHGAQGLEVEAGFHG